MTASTLYVQLNDLDPAPTHQSITEPNLQEADQTHLKGRETRAVPPNLRKKRWCLKIDPLLGNIG